MSHNYSKLFYHVLFSTKDRAPLLPQSVDSDLCAYTGGILRNLKCDQIAAGVFDDHMHLVISVPPQFALSDIVGKLKANSSRWLSSKKEVGQPFSWQPGFTAFTVSQARMRQAIEYVLSQRVHHTEQSFVEEVQSFMKAHGVKITA